MKATKTVEDAIMSFHVPQCVELVDKVKKSNQDSHRAAYKAKLKARIMRKAKGKT